MSIIQVPVGLSVAKQTWAQQRNDTEFRSMFGAQALEASGPMWATDLTPSLKRTSQWQALMLQLRGKTNQLAVWNMNRPQPLGTMRGTMMMEAAAQGATTLTITATGEASKTLLAGDYLGVGSGLTQQVVMVCADAVSNASGVIAVATEPALRNAFVASSSVTWYRPCALFRRKDSTTQSDYEPGGIVKVGVLSLLEDWRA